LRLGVRPRFSVTRAGIGPTAFDAIVRSLPGTKVVTRGDDTGARTEPWRGTGSGGPIQCFQRAPIGRLWSQPSTMPVWVPGWRPGPVKFRSGMRSLSGSVEARASGKPAATPEYLTRYALEAGRARFVHKVLRHRRPCGRSPGSRQAMGRMTMRSALVLLLA